MAEAGADALSSAGNEIDTEGDNQAVVIDCGSWKCSAGFSGDDSPRAVFPPIVGRPVDDGSQVGMSLKDTYVGDMARRKKPILNWEKPDKHWDDMEKIWHHTFYNELRVAPEEHPVLLTEATLSSRESREKTTEIMFESFKVPSLCVRDRSVLSLYASACTTGTVLNSGDKVTQAVPIYEHYVLSEDVKQISLGGRDITHFLCQKLKELGHAFCTTDEKLTVCDIKEKICYVTTNFDKEMAKPSSELEKSYDLPDGRKLTIGCERFQCTEPLFKPEMLGKVDAGIHRLVYDTIINCKEDVRKPLFSSIILSGGSTMFPGFEDRLRTELNKLVPTSMEVNVIASAEQKYSAWIGGAMFASLSNFSETSMTKEQYDEHGSRFIHTKC